MTRPGNKRLLASQRSNGANFIDKQSRFNNSIYNDIKKKEVIGDSKLVVGSGKNEKITIQTDGNDYTLTLNGDATLPVVGGGNVNGLTVNSQTHDIAIANNNTIAGDGTTNTLGDRTVSLGGNLTTVGNDITIDTHMILFNFVSSRMNAAEYDQGMTNLYYMAVKQEAYRTYYRERFMSNLTGEDADDTWKYYLHDIPRGLNLSSTPLNDCIMAAMKMVPAFQKKYNIDKMNTVFLTDGASDGGERIISMNDDDKTESDSWMTRRVGGDWKFKKVGYDANIILTDRQTKKSLPVGNARRHLTDALLKVLKQRTGCKVLGFFVDEKTTIGKSTLNRYFPQEDFYGLGFKTFDRKKVNAEFRKNKVLVVTENTGYDELYLLAGGKMNVVDSGMATPSENAKKGEIKRLFAGSLKNSKTSRVVLNKFIKQVA